MLAGGGVDIRTAEKRVVAQTGGTGGYILQKKEQPAFGNPTPALLIVA